MTLPALNLPNVVAAAAPLLIVLYLMIGRNWGGSKAGPAGWLAAVLVAVLIFGGDALLLVVSFGRALLLALFVLYIIWMALLLYHVVNEAGAIRVIGDSLPGLAQDRPGQALLLGWVFGSFLQGASGFGVPAAVVAPLLLGLGFAPNTAVVIALIGHAWAVTFGSLGSSFFSLMAATGQPGEILAGPAAGLLAFCCLACGFGVLWAAGGRAALARRWPQLLAVTVVMGGVQYGLALAGLWSLAAFGAGLVGLATIILDFRFEIFALGAWLGRFKRRESAPTLAESPSPGLGPASGQASPETAVNPVGNSGSLSVAWRTLAKALTPYLVLTVVIVLGQLVLKEPLSAITLNLEFPDVATRFGWKTAAGPGRSISVFGHAGALLLYASLLSFAWFRWQGKLYDGADYKAQTIWNKTLKGSIKPTIGIVSLVAMAVTMEHAGMTQLLAEALSATTGRVFPVLSAFIGALGAFMTGSNTNSNVVFGQLQQETATALGLSIPLILASQTAGGAIGSLFAPAKVVVGCSTVQGAQEGPVLRVATAYGLGIVVLVGLVVWLLTSGP